MHPENRHLQERFTRPVCVINRNLGFPYATQPVQRNSHVIGRLFEAMIRTKHFFQPFHNTRTTDEVGIASIRNDKLWNFLAD